MNDLKLYAVEVKREFSEDNLTYHVVAKNDKEAREIVIRELELDENREEFLLYPYNLDVVCGYKVKLERV